MLELLRSGGGVLGISILVYRIGVPGLRNWFYPQNSRNCPFEFRKPRTTVSDNLGNVHDTTERPGNMNVRWVVAEVGGFGNWPVVLGTEMRFSELDLRGLWN